MKIRQALPRLCLLLAFAIAPLHAFAAKNATELAPLGDGPTQVEFSTAQVSKWTDLPMGTYRVPNSDVIISGHQKGGAAPMLLFGVIGLAVQGSVNAGHGKEAMASAEQALTLVIDEEAKAKLQAALADPAYAGKFTSAATDPKLEITGAVVLSFARNQDVLPYVTLRVKLMGKGGKTKLWTTRYIASKGARKPLVGEGSWTADGGAMLRSHVSGLLDIAIGTMLKDIATPYPRDEASLVTVRGYFPHVNKPLQVVGYKLAEENGRMLFLPKLGTTIVFAGVNVLDSASVWQQPTAKGDKPLKLLKVDDPTLVGLVNPSAEPAPVQVADAGTDEAAMTDVDAAGATDAAATDLDATGAESVTTDDDASLAEPATNDDEATGAEPAPNDGAAAGE